jgi:hypothetical protein
LDYTHDSPKPLPELAVVGTKTLILPMGCLEIEERFLRRKIADLLLQRFNMGLGAFSDRALRLAIVGPFLGQLIGGEVGDTS